MEFLRRWALFFNKLSTTENGWRYLLDNIPGMKGIGAKFLAKLLAEYKTLESIHENKSDLKNKKSWTANSVITMKD